MLEALNLECIRGERQLFAGLSFRLEAGHALLLEGPNGSGKTSLLRILAGLTQAETGEVRWQDIPTSRDPAAFRNRLAYVGHAPGIKLELSPLENLRFAGRLHGTTKTPSAVLERVGLTAQADLPCRQLSAGQRRRVALARLLLIQVPLWLLDEPYTALDRDGVALVDELLGAHLKAGGLAVLSSHQPPTAELPLARLALGGRPAC